MSVVLDRLYHLHWVTPQIARCAQPYLGMYTAFLRPHGFKSLVNLRGENAEFRWWRREKEVAEALGIAHFDAKLSSRNVPSRSGLTALFNVFDAAEPPLLFKCSGGQDRTSLAVALYLLEKRGASALPLAEAQFAFWPYLHRPKSYQLWLKQFPVYALAEAKGSRLGTWVMRSYDPQAFAAWLARKGMAGSFRAFQAEVG